MLPLQILFWILVLPILYTYIVYPLLLKVWSRGLRPKKVFYESDDQLPHVSVLMAAYNEETLIAEKMENLLSLDYPKELIHYYVGSDCSSDRTNSIMETFAKKEKRLHFFPFAQRQGKAGVINRLSEEAWKDNGKVADHIFLMTDVSVMLRTDTLAKLVRHFRDPKIALVDSHIVGTNLKESGIAISENTYVHEESLLKYREGILWGTMIGPFGGCYALRADYYKEVPPKSLVDDFYISMNAMLSGGKSISDLEAICYEDISQDIREEFRRKVRISTGNFQNLGAFARIWKRPFSRLAFTFLSHKVLRWLSPFFIILSGIIVLYLSMKGYVLYQVIAGFYIMILFVLPLVDKLLQAIGIHLLPLRHIRYFVSMNLALFIGFFQFLRGVDKGIWEPTKRVLGG